MFKTQAYPEGVLINNKINLDCTTDLHGSEASQLLAQRGRLNFLYPSFIESITLLGFFVRYLTRKREKIRGFAKFILEGEMYTMNCFFCLRIQIFSNDFSPRMMERYPIAGALKSRFKWLRRLQGNAFQIAG